MELKYTITKFDEANKSLVVAFEDGSWAELRLATPLPTTMEELDNQIKHFAAPAEHIEAQNSTVDLSFINSFVGVERVTTRFRLNPSTPLNDEEKLLMEIQANENQVLEEQLMKVKIKAIVEQILDEKAQAI